MQQVRVLALETLQHPPILELQAVQLRAISSKGLGVPTVRGGSGARRVALLQSTAELSKQGGLTLLERAYDGAVARRAHALLAQLDPLRLLRCLEFRCLRLKRVWFWWERASSAEA